MLTEYEKAGGHSPQTLKELASLEEELGEPKEAAATLDRINYIDPVGRGLASPPRQALARAGELPRRDS